MITIQVTEKHLNEAIAARLEAPEQNEVGRFCPIQKAVSDHYQGKLIVRCEMFQANFGPHGSSTYIYWLRSEETLNVFIRHFDAERYDEARALLPFTFEAEDIWGPRP